MSAPVDSPEPLEPLDPDLRKLIEREAASHDETAVVARELERLEARLQALSPAEPAPSNVVPLRPRRFAVVASSVGGALVAAAAMWLLFVHPRQSSPAARSESAAAAPAGDTPTLAPSALPASPADEVRSPAVAPPAPLATAATPAAGPKQTAAAPSRSLDAGAPPHLRPKKGK